MNKSKKEAIKGYRLKSIYNITIEEYNDLLLDQNGRCKICNNESTARKLAVDHCHITGKVRGLLCNKCNMAIGLLFENEEIMLSALMYVVENNKLKAITEKENNT